MADHGSMTKAALLLSSVLLPAAAKAEDDCVKFPARPAPAAAARLASALVDEGRVRRGLARIGVRVESIQSDGPLSMDDRDRGVSRLARALKGVRAPPRRDAVAAQVVVSDWYGIEIGDNSIKLLVPHNAPSDSLAHRLKRLPLALWWWDAKKKIRNLMSVDHHLETFHSNPDSYLDWLGHLLKDLEGEGADNDLSRLITDIDITDGNRVTGYSNPFDIGIDGALKGVRLDVPALAWVEPGLLKTAKLEAWAGGLLTYFSRGKFLGTGKTDDPMVNNKGVEGADYDNALEKLTKGLSAALEDLNRHGEYIVEKARFAHVHFTPPGTTARTVPTTVDGRPMLDVHVPVDAEDPLGAVMDALSSRP